MLYIKHTKKMGRGLFAKKDIFMGDIIEESSVIIFSIEEYKNLKGTSINKYWYAWGPTVAIALGVGSLFNHSKKPNVDYTVDLIHQTITFKATKNIKKNTQAFIDYGYDPE